MYKLLPFLLSIVIFLCGCNPIPSDPIKGADKLYNALTDCAEKDDYNKASSLMKEYLDTYKESKERTLFFLCLRADFMDPSNLRIQEFFFDANLTEYPIFREYMGYIIAVAQAEALQQSSYSRTPAAEALLFCSLLVDYAKLSDYDNAIEVITNMYNRYKNADPMARTEFFITFRDFVKKSGEQGQILFQFINSIPKNENLTNFMRLSLESWNDY